MPCSFFLCMRLVCAVQRIIVLSQPRSLAFWALGCECIGASSSRKWHNFSGQQAMLHAGGLNSPGRGLDQYAACVSAVAAGAGEGLPRVMDDTVAMQDTNGPTLCAPISKGDACDTSTVVFEQPQVQPAAASQEGSRPECIPCAPQSPSMMTQQVLLLALLSGCWCGGFCCGRAVQACSTLVKTCWD
jgi:hypothetical protein